MEDALRLYLGADEAGAIQPVGMEDRLRNRHSSDFVVLHKAIQEILQLVMSYEPDWKADSLDSAMAMAGRRVRQEHPEFRDSTIRALENYFAFQWR